MRREALEDVQRLRDRHAARRRRRHREQRVAAIRRLHRLAPHRLVAREIRLGDDAAVALHLARRCARAIVAGVEARRALRRRCARSVRASAGCLSRVPTASGLPSGQKHARAGELREQPRVARVRPRLRAVDDEAFLGVANRRRHHVGERHRAVLRERLGESGDGARNAARERADDALVGELAVRVEVHVARRGERRDLAIVERRGAAVGHANDHVAAAADVAGLGIRRRPSRSRRRPPHRPRCRRA